MITQEEIKAEIQELIAEVTKHTSKILEVEFNQETYESLYGGDYVFHGYTGEKTITIRWFDPDSTK